MAKRSAAVRSRSGARSGRWAGDAARGEARQAANQQIPRGGRAAAEAVEPEALVASYWFDSGEHGEPYAATVRFTGRRVRAQGKPRAQDSFTQDETLEGVVPGTGPVSVTTTVYGLQPGEWTVTAELIRPSGNAGATRHSIRPSRGQARPVHPAAWSWRAWRLSAGSASAFRTRWALIAPLARRPGVLPGSYPALVALAALVALTMQAAILAGQGVSVTRGLVVSLLAIVSGLLGAKLWYAALHPEQSIIKGGWAVDGFLIVAPLVAAATLLASDLPIGLFLDASTPPLFFAVAIARLGCFLTGCCAGRLTASRWGVWSSDQRIGARRVPTQLLEAGSGLLIGVATLPVVLADVIDVRGAIFVAAFAIYAVVRQSLLRLRAEQRRNARSLPLTAASAGLVVVVVAVLSFTQ